MRILANIAKCAGHARCASVAPKLFILNEEGYLEISTIEVDADSEGLARRAIRACPERILTLEENNDLQAGTR
jgi:ferredoxin